MALHQAAETVGTRGEAQACEYLVSLGWVILDRNWRHSRTGELDIVARDSDGALVFVEVKARSGRAFGEPLEAITYAKVARLRQLAAVWLASHDLPGGVVRIDAIGVVFDRSGSAEITHIPGVAS